MLRFGSWKLQSRQGQIGRAQRYRACFADTHQFIYVKGGVSWAEPVAEAFCSCLSLCLSSGDPIPSPSKSKSPARYPPPPWALWLYAFGKCLAVGLKRGKGAWLVYGYRNIWSRASNYPPRKSPSRCYSILEVSWQLKRDELRCELDCGLGAMGFHEQRRGPYRPLFSHESPPFLLPPFYWLA